MIATQTAACVRFRPESDRSQNVLRAFAASPDVTSTLMDAYDGAADWLVFWGPGAPERGAVMQQHVARGGHAIAADLSYWNRDRKFRISIDAPHPQAWVMRRAWPASRFTADPVRVASLWNQKGPVIVAGIGRKARAQYDGDAVLQWETAMITALRARGQTVHYRPKQTDAPVPGKIPVIPVARPIDQVLEGASLVVTWHSNVAVDAIRLGVPVICRDGAAAAICQSVLGEELPKPLPIDLRDTFLANLAHFQWSVEEVRDGACWAFIRELVG